MAVWAALALVAALPASPAAAEEGGGALDIRCEGDTVSVLEARGAPIDAVLMALEQECGLRLVGAGNIPERPVTAAYQRATLEEVVEALIRLTDLPNTLLATASSGVLKLVVLATGEDQTNTKWRPRAPKRSNGFALDEDEVREAAREATLRQFYLAGTDRERQRALKELKGLDPDEAWILQQSDAEELAADRAEAAAEEAQRQFYLAQSEGERQRALKELSRLDPDESDYLQGLSLEELADDQNKAALKEARTRFLLAPTDEERQRALAEIKRFDPDEAEALTK